MRMEFENCIEYEGSLQNGDLRTYELNSLGKPPMIKSKDLNRVKINNTNFDAAVTFKLCIGGSKTNEGSIVAVA